MPVTLPPHLASAEATIADPAAAPDQLAGLFNQLHPLGLGPGASDALFDETRRLIWRIAHNPNTPPGTLARIAGMSYPSARAVARNPGFSLTLMTDPLCRDDTTEWMVRSVTQRWPSDNELLSALRPWLRRATDIPPSPEARQATEALDAVTPALLENFRHSALARDPVCQALMLTLNPTPLPDQPHTPSGSCLMGSGFIHCATLLQNEVRLENALATTLGLRFERWFEGLPT